MVRIPLPPELRGAPFAVASGREAGLSAKRLRGADLARPFWGVRAPAEPTDTAALAAAYASRMPAHSFFSHSTAALLHGIPLPLSLRGPLPLHVSVPNGSTPSASSSVAGHRIAIEPIDIVQRRGLRMTSLVRTVLDLAPLLADEDLLAAIDNTLWRKRRDGHRATAGSLRAALGRFSGRRGRARVAALIPLGTDRADSPPESAIRLRFLRADLPRMLVNVGITSAEGFLIAQPDLQFPDYRMAYDYEGDHHRTDPAQWRKDLARVPRLQDAGWHHTRISAADLADSTELLNRTRRLLRERGWTG